MEHRQSAIFVCAKRMEKKAVGHGRVWENQNALQQKNERGHWAECNFCLRQKNEKTDLDKAGFWETEIKKKELGSAIQLKKFA